VAVQKETLMKALITITVIAAAPAFAKDVTPATIQLGQQLYATNCAACHGANLQGQPDWKHRLASGRMPAPPHDVTGHTWHHSDRDLFNLTKLGVAAVMGDGYESDMPAFGGKLSDDDINAVLDYIKSTWPRRALASQAAITAADVAQNPTGAGQ
jgi:mono/diheme cytochrome c family protein